MWSTMRRQLLPKPHDDSNTLSTSHFLAVASLISDGSRKSPEDLQYFQYFRQEYVNELSGGWNEPLWHFYLLQACHETSFIYNMALTLAAQGRSERMKRLGYGSAASYHHETYSLRQYARSIKEIRQCIASADQPDMRMFLLASLLIFIFEFKQGNMDTAVRQVRSTVTVFKNMSSIESPVYIHDHDVRFPEILEDVVIDMIARLDKPGFVVQVKQQHNNEKRIAGTSILGLVHRFPARTAIPDVFPNVFTARRYISFMQYWGIPNFANDAIKYVKHYIQQVQGKELEAPPVSRAVSAQEFWDRFVEVKHWHITMDKLLRRLDSWRNSEYMCALSVRIQGLATTLVMACEIGFHLETSTNVAMEAVELEYGGIRGLCQEMLHLGRIVVHDPGFLRCYIFDYGIIVCMVVILFATDDHGLEQQVIQILKDTRPRREGMWDSCAMVEIVEMIVRNRSKTVEVSF